MRDTLTRPLCVVRWLGRIDYNEAWELQRDLARQRAAGDIHDTLLLLEHDPVYTTGRADVTGNLRVSPEALGATVVRSDRGGDITFHGPGQLVAYPIVDLKAVGLGVGRYVRSLEEVVVRTLHRYGIEAVAECGLTGVWVGEQKIAAIGVRVGRPLGGSGPWITTHGLALNVDVDLDWFAKIVACGIRDRGVTSIARLIGWAPGVREVAQSISRDFADVFGRALAAQAH
ncbi:MAG: lipoyl(octanoyl) transferase LipB [Dehalococcoidia bacterium]